MGGAPEKIDPVGRDELDGEADHLRIASRVDASDDAVGDQDVARRDSANNAAAGEKNGEEGLLGHGERWTLKFSCKIDPKNRQPSGNLGS